MCSSLHCTFALLEVNMATTQKIIDMIDAFLEDKIPLTEAVEWAQKELNRTPDCEDPAFALYTFICSDDPEKIMGRPLKEQLHMDKEVLVHGVPCLHEELGKTVEAFWLAYTPWEKIVLCQVKTKEDGERVLEITEEGWDGTQLFFEEIPIPLKDKNGSFLTLEEIKKKKDAFWSRKATEKESLQWIIDQLKRENMLRRYQRLLFEYWRIRRKDHQFTMEYIEETNKLGSVPEALLKQKEVVRKNEEGNRAKF